MRPVYATYSHQVANLHTVLVSTLLIIIAAVFQRSAVCSEPGAGSWWKCCLEKPSRHDETLATHNVQMEKLRLGTAALSSTGSLLMPGGLVRGTEAQAQPAAQE